MPNAIKKQKPLSHKALDLVQPEGDGQAEAPSGRPFTLTVNAVFQKRALRFMADLSGLLFPGETENPAAATDEGLNAALAETGTLLGVSRAYVMLDEADGRYLRNTHEWVDGKIGPAMHSWPLHEYAKDIPSLKPLMVGREFFSGHTRDLPRDLEMTLSKQSVHSVLLVPLLQEGSWIGLAGLDSCGRERDWREEETAILRRLARLVVVALERRDYLSIRWKYARIREVLAEDQQEAPEWRERTLFLPDNDLSLLDIERRTILNALELFQGNRMQAARHLGLTWNALNRRCKKLRIEVKKRG